MVIMSRLDEDRELENGEMVMVNLKEYGMGYILTIQSDKF